MFPEVSRPGPWAVALLESPCAMPISTSNGLFEMCCPANNTVIYNKRENEVRKQLHSFIFLTGTHIYLVHACDFRDVEDRVGAVLVVVSRHFGLKEKAI